MTVIVEKSLYILRVSPKPARWKAESSLQSSQPVLSPAQKCVVVVVSCSLGERISTEAKKSEKRKEQG